MSNPTAVFRPVITTDEILGTLEALSSVPANQMPSGARSLVNKFRMQAFKIDAGIAKPAYVNTGTKKQGISLESLGASEDEFIGTHNPDRITPDMLSASNSNSGTKPSAELDDEESRLLEELDRQMREELATNGAGSQNVILEDRRKVPRDNQVEAINVSQL